MLSEQKSPTFVMELVGVDASLGERVRLECRVNGRPKPSIAWKKDGKSIQVSSRVRIIEAYTNHILLISRSELSDQGVYEAVATNQHGVITSQATVNIKGSNTNGATEPPTQRLSTSSRKSSTSSTSSTGHTFRSQTVSQRSFHSNSWMSKVGGNVTQGLSSISGNSPRRRGPGFILRPKPKSLSVGESLHLKCTLLGHPKPTVTWEKDGELVDESRTDGHIRTAIEGNNYMLDIEEVNENDGGKYAVTARNSLGKQMASVIVTIVDGNGNVQKTNGKEDLATKMKKLTIPEGKVATETGKIPASPTGSVSSQFSVQSKQSTVSSRSNLSNRSEDRGSDRESVKKVVAPSITRRLSSTQIVEGDELLLQCVITGDPEPSLQWMRNGNVLQMGREEGIFTSFREGVARLRLRDVGVQDGGEYMCVARNKGGQVKCTSRVTVKAKAVNKAPRFLKKLSDVRVTEGESLKLEVVVEGIPEAEIMWTCDGMEVPDADCSFVNNIARLVIHQIKMKHTGQFMCSASNSAGEDSLACRVRVKERVLSIKPEFTSGLSDVTVRKDGTLRLKCMVTSVPEPTIEWFCNNELIDDEYEGVVREYTDGMATLVLDKVQVDDSGQFVCRATNQEGQDETKCHVTVEDPAPAAEEKIPSVETQKPPSSKTPSIAPKFLDRPEEFVRAQEGDKIVLKCQFRGSPPPQVTWSHQNGKPVEGAVQNDQNGQTTLTIGDIKQHHSGMIKCTISNSVGKADHETRLSIRSRRVAPTIETELPDCFTIDEGSTGEIFCKVAGHPQPRVSWTRNGRSLSILSTETLYEDGVATVRIRKATARDSGKYLCTIRNLSGQVETSCKVTVTSKSTSEEKPNVEPPSFEDQLVDVALDDGQDLKLQCKVKGVPEPKVYWLMDGEPLNLEETETSFKDGVASLLLEDCMREDQGKYTLVAENSEGKAENSCNVVVNVNEKQSEPVFEVQLKDATVKKGDDIHLKCKISGNPKPEVRWLVDGEAVDESAEMKQDEDGNFELILQDSLPEDEGIYSCVAENHINHVISSCKITVDSAEETNGHANGSAEDSPPLLLQELEDAKIADGMKNYTMTIKVKGNPPPVATWLFNGEPMEENEDFRWVSRGEERSLVLGEVFPEDTGEYTCEVENRAGRVKSTCHLTVEEIDGSAPEFLLKPRSFTANIGEKAIFSCKIQSDPEADVSWLFNNKPVKFDENVVYKKSSSENNNTHKLEINNVRAEDAGRYAVQCSNILGSVTCTVSLIVDNSKKQEAQTDFRNVLRKSSSGKSPTSPPPQPSNQDVDFRSVLRKTSEKQEAVVSSQSDSDDQKDTTGLMYKEALSTQVKTKALTEDEIKQKKAEQIDFRSATLTRKVDTKAVVEEDLKSKQPDQQDFREEALTKLNVQTKLQDQEHLKKHEPKQVDFRNQAIKKTVKTKEYDEEVVKTRKVEQVDFREVLQSKKSSSEDQQDQSSLKGTLKKSELTSNNNLVATRRSRGKEVKVPVKNQVEQEDVFMEENFKPEFTQQLKDVKVEDGKAFELICVVEGDPTPEVKWFLEGEEDVDLENDEEFIIEYKNGICSLAVNESFADDEGRYVCMATNKHGSAVTSSMVTVCCPPDDQQAEEGEC